jgi:hypothetical protein
MIRTYLLRWGRGTDSCWRGGAAEQTADSGYNNCVKSKSSYKIKVVYREGMTNSFDEKNRWLVI